MLCFSCKNKQSHRESVPCSPGGQGLPIEEVPRIRLCHTETRGIPVPSFTESYIFLKALKFHCKLCVQGWRREVTEEGTIVSTLPVSLPLLPSPCMCWVQAPLSRAMSPQGHNTAGHRAEEHMKGRACLCWAGPRPAEALGEGQSTGCGERPSGRVDLPEAVEHGGGSDLAREEEA